MYNENHKQKKVIKTHEKTTVTESDNHWKTQKQKK